MDGTKRSVLTDSSNKPTGRDANFLQVTNQPPRPPYECCRVCLFQGTALTLTPFSPSLRNNTRHVPRTCF